MISCITNTDNDFFDETENQLCSNLTILHLICAFDQTYLLKHFLLYYGLAAVSRITTISKQTLIHICAWYGSNTCLALLMRNGISIEDKNNQGQLPLHLAAFTGNNISLQTLLKEMDNPNVTDLDGNSALHIAVIHDKLQCTDDLLKFENVCFKIFFC